MRHFTFAAGGQVDSVDRLAVGRVGVADGEFARVVLGLRETFAGLFVPSFGFDDGKFVIAVDEDVVGDRRFWRDGRDFF